MHRLDQHHDGEQGGREIATAADRGEQLPGASRAYRMRLFKQRQTAEYLVKEGRTEDLLSYLNLPGWEVQVVPWVPGSKWGRGPQR